jgi:hypothetical protein
LKGRPGTGPTIEEALEKMPSLLTRISNASSKPVTISVPWKFSRTIGPLARIASK